MDRLILALLCSIAVSGCQYRPPDSWDTYVAYGYGFHFSHSPSPSPDGQWVTFCSPRSGRFDIYRANVRSGTIERLTESPDFECNPLYGPTGSRIFYEREVHGWRRIWAMDSDGENERELLGEPRKQCNLLDVSSDGKQLLIRRAWHAGGLALSGDLVVLDALRGRIVATLADASLGAFGPGGDMIVCTFSCRPGIWLTYIGDTRLRCLSERGAYPLFTSDGRIIYHDAANKREGVGYVTYIIDIGDETKRKLGFTAFPTVTPDGKLAWIPLGGKQVLHVLDIESGTTRRIPLPGTGAAPPVACPSDSGVFVRIWTDDDPPGEVYYVCFRTWSVHHVCSID